MLNKYGHENRVFLWTFLQNMYMRAFIFSLKIRKKEVFMAFLAHNILQFSRNLRFFTK